MAESWRSPPATMYFPGLNFYVMGVDDKLPQ